jgi:hypothetical protein
VEGVFRLPPELANEAVTSYRFLRLAPLGGRGLKVRGQWLLLFETALVITIILCEPRALATKEGNRR